jgi:NAD(P)-dependent dehydrogenase (short-subunit alcohol dehydrogenase family)
MPSNPDAMKGKTVLITGATGGIGKATAFGLADLGATLVLVGRNDDRLTQVKDELAERDHRGVKTMKADLSSMAEVRQLAADVVASVPRLDVLINNAGTIVGDRCLTADGYEYTFALDHLSPFLLTKLLLGTLKASAPSRIITVSSAAHYAGTMHFDDLMLERGYRPFKAYSQAKLANVLFTYELARRLEGSGVTANCLHPGTVRTNFGKELRGASRVATAIIRPFEFGPKKGARTPIYLASSPEVDGVSGRYFVRCRPHRSSVESHNKEEAMRLWEESERLTGPRAADH